jgi:hypothetical protein
MTVALERPGYPFIVPPSFWFLTPLRSAAGEPPDHPTGETVRLLFLPILLLAWLTASAATAQLVNENLLWPLPEGYKIGFQNKANGILMTEAVPTGETVESWTEMVTVQIFYGRKSPPAQAKASMETVWARECPGSSSNPIFSGDENGYPVVLWLMSCPLNKQSGKSEITWMKAIGGNDSLYVVQKAFKFEPSKEQIVQWTQYLRKVAVCDTRRPDRSCPAVSPK